MKDYTLDDLKKQLKKVDKKDSTRRKDRYALARSLGFNSYEARILMFKPEETIKRLAKEKNNGKTDKTRD